MDLLKRLHDIEAYVGLTPNSGGGGVNNKLTFASEMESHALLRGAEADYFFNED